MFDEIWKEQIVKPVGKVGIFKPKQGFDLEEEDDGDCNKKLQEYANKIKNTPLPLKELWNDKDFENYKPLFNEDSRIFSWAKSERFALFKKEDDDSINFHEYIEQRKMYKYNPIPENVACKSLEMLKNYDLLPTISPPMVEDEMNGYKIRIDGSTNKRVTWLELTVLYKKRSVIRLGLERDITLYDIYYYKIFDKYALDVDWR